jgi:hexokinase
MALRSKEPLCHLGVIFGTGTNSCYVEHMPNITKWRVSLNPMPYTIHPTPCTLNPKL